MHRRRSYLTTALSELGEVADAAALEPGRWADFIDLLRRKTLDSKIIFQVLDHEASKCLPIHSIGFMDSTLRNYTNYYAGISPWRDLMIRSTVKRAVWSDHLLPQDELRKTEFYNDLLRPEGQMDGATGISLISEGSRAAVLAVHYDGRFGQEMHSFVGSILQGIAGRMRQSLDVNRVIAQATPRFRGDVSLLHALETPALIVTASGRVMASNQALADILGRNDAVAIGSGDLLRFGLPEVQALFIERLRHRADGLRYQPPPDDLVLNHPETPMTISILPIAGPVPDTSGVAVLFPSPASFLVVLRPYGKADSVDEARRRLVSDFRLTQAEIRLVLALERGDSLGAFAEANNLSLHTVRTHLKSIFSKTNTHRQHELVALTGRLRR